MKPGMHLAQAQAGRDALEAGHRAGAVVARAHERAPGASLDPALARVVHALEEILEHPGDAAEVLGRAEEVAARGEDVVDTRLVRPARNDLDPADAARAVLGRLRELRGAAELRVVDDEQHRCGIRSWTCHRTRTPAPKKKAGPQTRLPQRAPRRVRVTVPAAPPCVSR
ncbi:MAG: hypothetical protein IPF73_05530 [Betaproteobacteria bacterium]|nr:hypothetical protein [Betaproteobacteria bacterium]